MERKNAKEKDMTKGDHIARLLEEDILSGFLPEGSPVPSQGETAKRFNVSTRSVREAYKVLEAKGLIESSQGRCATVKSVTLPGVIDMIRDKEKLSKAKLEKDRFRFLLDMERIALENAMKTRNIDERLIGGELFPVDTQYILAWHSALLMMADNAISLTLAKEGEKEHIKALEKALGKNSALISLSKRLIKAVSEHDAPTALALFAIFKEEAQKAIFKA